MKSWTNTERAAAAERALNEHLATSRFHRPKFQSLTPHEKREAIQDLMTDLMHLARRSELDPALLTETAGKAHGEEVLEEAEASTKV